MNLQNQRYIGSNNRESLVDIITPNDFNNKLIIFIHGYMGYKDWGCWPIVEKYYTDLGYGFCKYNVSHNGGTIEQPIDFSDLNAFGENNYSKELFDLQQVINWIELKFDNRKYIGIEDIRIFNDIETNKLLFIGTGLHHNNSLGIVTGEYNVESLSLNENEIVPNFSKASCEKIGRLLIIIIQHI